MTTYIRYARSGHEKPIALEIARRGCIPELIAESYIQRTGRGKTRSTELFERPALPNILFVEMGPEDHGRLDHIKGLSQAFEILPDAARADVLRFKTAIALRNEAVIREFNRSGAATPLFDKGAPVELTEGPFKDFLGTFLGMVQEGEEYLCKVETGSFSVNVPMDQLRAAE